MEEGRGNAEPLPSLPPLPAPAHLPVTFIPRGLHCEETAFQFQVEEQQPVRKQVSRPGKVLRTPNPLPRPHPTRGCPCAAGSPRAALGVPAAGSLAAAPVGAATSAPEAAGGVVSERRGPRARSGGTQGGSLARELGRRPQRQRGPREGRERSLEGWGRGPPEAEPKGTGPLEGGAWGGA